LKQLLSLVVLAKERDRDCYAAHAQAAASALTEMTQLMFELGGICHYSCYLLAPQLANVPIEQFLPVPRRRV
jgi:hypothetical protein